MRRFETPSRGETIMTDETAVDTRPLPDEPDLSETTDAPSPYEIEAAREAVARDFPRGAPSAGEIETAGDAGAFGFAPADPEHGSAELAAADSFGHLDPGGAVPPKLLQAALDFFQANRSKFANQTHISVLDYGLSSREKRFHVINMATGQVLSLRMAHGKGSDPNHDGVATSFGNAPGSNKSSLGFVRTAETYSGKHGRSLRLDGLSPENSNMRARAVVIHGAGYVQDKPVIQGRSEGCPAVPMHQKDKLIDLIKGGSLLFAGRSK
jgi:hypothetical protein